MKIKYKDINESIIPNFNGGTKEFNAHIYNDGTNKIITRGKLIKGASIGLHKHEGTQEIIYIISGVGKMICDDIEEILEPGDVHYCSEGQSHSFINDGSSDLIFFAVVTKL